MSESHSDEATVILRRSTKSTHRSPEQVVAIPRSLPLTRHQALMKRYQDWKTAHLVGMPNPETHALERRPIAVIAAIYGVTPQAVRDGIRMVDKTREAIANVSSRATAS